MAPVAVTPTIVDGATPVDRKAKIQTEVQPAESAILHRVPWALPIAVSGKRSEITLEDGRVMIDAVGGAAVTAVGMGHKKVINAIKEQTEKLAYVYSMQLSNRPAEELATYLVKSGKGAWDACFFVCGGSEAMDAAIKLARQYWFELGQPERTNFIARQLSYHGNTLGALNLSSHPARRAPYEGILNKEGYHHVSPPYAKRFMKAGETEDTFVERLKRELEAKIEELGPHTVIGFMAETVGGATSGVVCPPKGYFKAMKSVCDKYGILYMLDEIMCGMGRMGTLHAWESYGDGIAPDIQTMAKGLGGGYQPIGAIIMSPKVSKAVRGGTGFLQNGHTYQMNPILCAASLAVQSVIQEEDLLANCQKQGALLSSLLRERLAAPSPAAPFVFDIRGGGLFWAIELDDSEGKFRQKHPQTKLGSTIQARCFDKNLIIIGMDGGSDVKGSSGTHLILAPPYNVDEQEIRKIVNLLVPAIEEVLGDL